MSEEDDDGPSFATALDQAIWFSKSAMCPKSLRGDVLGCLAYLMRLYQHNETRKEPTK